MLSVAVSGSSSVIRVIAVNPAEPYPSTNPDGPIPDSRFPIPDSRFPIPDSRFPIPDQFANLSGNCFAIAIASGSAIIIMWLAAERSAVYAVL